MRDLFMVLENRQFWLIWQNFKFWDRSEILIVSNCFILMMDANSQIYIKSNFQHPKISMKKIRLLLIFKVVKIASEINENAFWSFICSRKTLNSCFINFILLQYTSKSIVVLMMFNTKFWMSKLNFVNSENLIIFEIYWK